MRSLVQPSTPAVQRHAGTHNPDPPQVRQTRLYQIPRPATEKAGIWVGTVSGPVVSAKKWAATKSSHASTCFTPFHSCCEKSATCPLRGKGGGAPKPPLQVAKGVGTQRPRQLLAGLEKLLQRLCRSFQDTHHFGGWFSLWEC